MSTTKIEWADDVWNPVTGCTKVSPGCAHCYAERMAKRLKAMGKAKYRNGFQVTCHEDSLDEPLRWKKPRRIFVCSMSDLFHDEVPETFIQSVWEIMAGAPQHTFLILTKRPQRMRQTLGWVLPNVHVGFSASTQADLEAGFDDLLSTPAAVRWLSLEPLLEVVDPCLRNWHSERYHIDWVVVGGESGPGARPMDPDWARLIRDDCQAAGVPFYMKQLGGHPNKRAKLEDLPEDLRIRELPDAERSEP